MQAGISDSFMGHRGMFYAACNAWQKSFLSKTIKVTILAHIRCNTTSYNGEEKLSSVVSIYPHRLLAFSQNVRPGEGSVPTGPTTGKLQSLMTSRAEKGTQDLMR